MLSLRPMKFGVSLSLSPNLLTKEQNANSTSVIVITTAHLPSTATTEIWG